MLSLLQEEVLWKCVLKSVGRGGTLCLLRHFFSSGLAGSFFLRVDLATCVIIPAQNMPKTICRHRHIMITSFDPWRANENWVRQNFLENTILFHTKREAGNALSWRNWKSSGKKCLLRKQKKKQKQRNRCQKFLSSRYFPNIWFVLP